MVENTFPLSTKPCKKHIRSTTEHWKGTVEHNFSKYPPITHAKWASQRSAAILKSIYNVFQQTHRIQAPPFTGQAHNISVFWLFWNLDLSSDL